MVMNYYMIMMMNYVIMVSWTIIPVCSSSSSSSYRYVDKDGRCLECTLGGCTYNAYTTDCVGTIFIPGESIDGKYQLQEYVNGEVTGNCLNHRMYASGKSFMNLAKCNDDGTCVTMYWGLADGVLRTYSDSSCPSNIVTDLGISMISCELDNIIRLFNVSTSMDKMLGSSSSCTCNCVNLKTWHVWFTTYFECINSEYRCSKSSELCNPHVVPHTPMVGKNSCKCETKYQNKQYPISYCSGTRDMCDPLNAY